ncbi:hypothetical protein FRB94_006074 [Tulasnella sp. JGI-2019a]|nr:hypothetical protein FRB93_007770 [Tulasnella sp. JGI-2019a]KAG9012458.1 hypothetical protein FRB94_006074 [Tulasnella sp. JGI-2019a]
MSQFALPLEDLLHAEAFSETPTAPSPSTDGSESTYILFYSDDVTPAPYPQKYRAPGAPLNEGSIPALDNGGEKPHKSKKDQTRVHVSNLAKEVTHDELTTLFGEIGQLKSVVHFKRRDVAYAYVDYETPEGARKAINRFNGTLLHAQLITAEVPDRRRKKTSGMKKKKQVSRDTSESTSATTAYDPSVTADDNCQLKVVTVVDPLDLVIDVTPFPITSLELSDIDMNAISISPTTSTSHLSATPSTSQDNNIALPPLPVSQPQIAYLIAPLGLGYPSPTAIILPSPTSVPIASQTTGLQQPVLANGLVSPGIGQHVLSDLHLALEDNDLLIGTTHEPTLLNAADSSTMFPSYPNPYFCHLSTALRYPYPFQPYGGGDTPYYSCSRAMVEPATGFFRHHSGREGEGAWDNELQSYQRSLTNLSQADGDSGSFCGADGGMGYEKSLGRRCDRMYQPITINEEEVPFLCQLSTSTSYPSPFQPYGWSSSPSYSCSRAATINPTTELLHHDPCARKGVEGSDVVVGHGARREKVRNRVDHHTDGVSRRTSSRNKVESQPPSRLGVKPSLGGSAIEEERGRERYDQPSKSNHCPQPYRARSRSPLLPRQPPSSPTKMTSASPVSRRAGRPAGVN